MRISSIIAAAAEVAGQPEAAKKYAAAAAMATDYAGKTQDKYLVAIRPVGE